QFVNCFVEAVLEIDERVASPKLLLQLLAGDDLARTLEQNLQNRQGLGVELDLQSILAEFPSDEVRLEDTEADSLVAHRFFVGGLCLGRKIAHLPRPKGPIGAKYITAKLQSAGGDVDVSKLFAIIYAGRNLPLRDH